MSKPFVFDPDYPDNRRVFYRAKYPGLWSGHTDLAMEVAVDHLEEAVRILTQATPLRTDRSAAAEHHRSLAPQVRRVAAESRYWLAVHLAQSGTGAAELS